MINNDEINLWILTDEHKRIYYTGFSEETVREYKESNFYKDKQIVKLTGHLALGETKNV
jgi:hypothetical protein